MAFINDHVCHGSITKQETQFDNDPKSIVRLETRILILHEFL